MAEEEIIKEHAKHAVQDLMDKTKKWKDRIKDFAWEVFIILVAVNVTLWFHNWNDQRHNRELEKDFLIGTRNDLDIIKNDLDNRLSFLQSSIDFYDSIWVQINEHRIDKAFIDTNSDRLLLANPFVYDNSRFESFKSSGYLRLIENTVLSKDITQIYLALQFHANIDMLFFNEKRRDFITYIGSKAPIDSSGKMLISDMLNTPDVKFQIMYYRRNYLEFHNMKQQLRQNVVNIIDAIDKELKTRFNYKGK